MKATPEMRPCLSSHSPESAQKKGPEPMYSVNQSEEMQMMLLHYWCKLIVISGIEIVWVRDR